MKTHAEARPQAPARIDDALDADARARLDETVADVRATPNRIGRVFPSVGRRFGRGQQGARDPHGRPLSTEDAVRAILLDALLGADPTAFAERVVALYRFGDSSEKHGVLVGLDLLPPDRTRSAASAMPSGAPAAARVADPLVDAVLADALRSNDSRLIGAAMRCAYSQYLDQARWRDGVMKCLFVGIDLAEVRDLAARTDDELTTAVGRFVAERVAASRDVPADVWLVIDRDDIEPVLESERDSVHRDRREAAARFLRSEPTQTAGR